MRCSPSAERGNFVVVGWREIVEVVEVPLGQCDANGSIGMSTRRTFAIRYDDHVTVEFGKEFLELFDAIGLCGPSTHFTTNRITGEVPAGVFTELTNALSR